MPRHVGFALLYGAGAGIGSIPGALLLRHDIDRRLGLALILFAAGAASAGLVSSWLMGRWWRSRPRSARFAGAVIVLTFFTCFFDAFFFYLHYISYFSQFWADLFTPLWFASLIFTGGGVTFFFVSIGLPMLLPLGLPVMLAAAYVLSRPASPR